MLYGPTPYAEVIERGARPADDGAAQRRAAGRGVRLGADRRGGAAVRRPGAGRGRADRGERAAPRPRVRRRRGALAAAARRGARGPGRRRGGDAAAAAGAPAGPVVDHRQAPAAPHLRHDDPRRGRPARGPGDRRPGRVDARLGRRRACSARSCWPCRRRSRAPAPAISDAARRHLAAPSGRRRCGRAPRGRPALAEAQAAVARRQRRSRHGAGAAASRRPSSSSGPASRSTPSAAAGAARR